MATKFQAPFFTDLYIDNMQKIHKQILSVPDAHDRDKGAVMFAQAVLLSDSKLTLIICSSVRKSQKPSIMRMASTVPAIIKSSLLSDCSCIVGLMMMRSPTIPTCTPATALLRGMSAHMYQRVYTLCQWVKLFLMIILQDKIPGATPLPPSACLFSSSSQGKDVWKTAGRPERRNLLCTTSSDSLFLYVSTDVLLLFQAM